MTTNVFWQHSDNQFRTGITAADGGVSSSADFTDAEYIIADRQGNIKLRLTLNNGITRSGADFLTKIDDGVLTFSGVFEHQFVVYDLDGNKLPPVFKNKLKILPTFRQE